MPSRSLLLTLAFLIVRHQPWIGTESFVGLPDVPASADAHAICCAPASDTGLDPGRGIRSTRRRSTLSSASALEEPGAPVSPLAAPLPGRWTPPIPGGVGPAKCAKSAKNGAELARSLGR